MEQYPVTVLMGVYNAAAFLQDSVGSILRQSFPAFELLVINDGSSDKSAEVLAGFQDKRLTVLQNPANLGLIATLNRGLDSAKGKYIVRMDADDIALPQRLQRLVDYMEAHPEVGVCGSAIRHFGESETVWTPPLTDESVRVRLLWDNALAHPSVIMRRELLDRFALRYRAEYPHCEDYRLWTECVQHFPVCNVPEVLLRYRLHPAQVSKRRSNEQNASFRRILMAYIAQTLGLSTDEDAFLPHRQLSRCETLERLEDLQAVGRWADLLLQTNQRIGAFAAAEFCRQLGKRWARLCRRSKLSRGEARRAFFGTQAQRFCTLYEKASLFVPRRKQ